MNKKWGLWTLTMFVVGNMVGGGIFMLPANLAKDSGALGSTLAWALTGFGVLMIALVFGNLAIRKPNLKAGPQSYAQSLFKSKKAGKIAGYSMAWGYWAANWSATASVIISFVGYLTTFFPIM
jgi:arginine:ornithine antiporter/lysine permease